MNVYTIWKFRHNIDFSIATEICLQYEVMRFHIKKKTIGKMDAK